jgi:hypothetical protein
VELISLFCLFFPGPLSNDKVIIQGKSDQPLECYFSRPLACSWRDLLFCHSFLIVPESPMSLLGQDLLSQLKLKFSSPRQLSLLPPPSKTKRSHSVNWWNEYRVSLMALPIQIKLKNTSRFPHPKQYPLKTEGWWRLLPIINSLKKLRATN